MPPAYEVLLLNTAIPQIQAAQSGDTYVCPRDIAFSAALTLSAGTANGVPYLNGSKVLTTGSALQFDGSNLGLGVTPSAWGGAYKAIEFPGISVANLNGGTNQQAQYLLNAYDSGTGAWKYKITGVGAAMYRQAADGSHEWHRAASGTAGNAITFTQAMTLDASGNLLVGTTTSPNQQTVIYRTSATTSNGALLLDGNGNYAGIQFAESGNLRASLAVDNSALYLTHESVLTFRTGSTANVGGTERARITSGGYFKASNDGNYVGSTGSYHELKGTQDGGRTVIITASNATNPVGARIHYSGATPNGTGNQFIYCDDSTALRAEIRSNGGLANYQSNNVDLSDARTKTDINPLASYWNKIAALEIVTYKYKDQTHDDLNIGVIAQQVEQVAPEFVDADGFGETPEDGVPLKTIYNKDLTFAAIKALQEAMARIEKLEAEVAALKGA